MQEVTPRQPVTEVDGFVGVEPEHCASLKGAASSQLSGSQRSPVSNCLLARNSVLMASFSNKMTPSAQAPLTPNRIFKKYNRESCESRITPPLIFAVCRV